MVQISKENQGYDNHSSNEGEHENYTAISAQRTRLTTEFHTHRLKTNQEKRGKAQTKMEINQFAEVGQNSEELEATQQRTRPCTSNTHYMNQGFNTKSNTTNRISKRLMEQSSEIDLQTSPRLKNFQSHANLVYGNPVSTLESIKKQQTHVTTRVMSGAAYGTNTEGNLKRNHQ